jgi:hypothetical protein
MAAIPAQAGIQGFHRRHSREGGNPRLPWPSFPRRRESKASASAFNALGPRLRGDDGYSGVTPNATRNRATMLYVAIAAVISTSSPVSKRSFICANSGSSTFTSRVIWAA